MNPKERLIIATILAMVAIMVVFDLLTDSREGIFWPHIFIEAGVGLSALVGVFYIFKDKVKLKIELEKSIENMNALKIEAQVWKTESQKYAKGLSLAIDHQLTQWNLSVAEKEVAFLLLKGLSLKEIAEVRGTTEKTARVQSMAIYSKSGLGGRSELSAFFLEDLLHPQTVPGSQFP